MFFSSQTLNFFLSLWLLKWCYIFNIMWSHFWIVCKLLVLAYDCLRLAMRHVVSNKTNKYILCSNQKTNVSEITLVLKCVTECILYNQNKLSVNKHNRGTSVIGTKTQNFRGGDKTGLGWQYGRCGMAIFICVWASLTNGSDNHYESIFLSSNIMGSLHIRVSLQRVSGPFLGLRKYS